MEAAVRSRLLSFLEEDRRLATGDCQTFQSGGFGSLRMLLGILSGTSTGDRSFGGDVAGRKWTLNVRIASSTVDGRFGHFGEYSPGQPLAPLSRPATFMASARAGRACLPNWRCLIFVFRPTGRFLTGGQCFV